jgi:hypothetical protein
MVRAVAVEFYPKDNLVLEIESSAGSRVAVKNLRA